MKLRSTWFLKIIVSAESETIFLSFESYKMAKWATLEVVLSFLSFFSQLGDVSALDL